MNQENQSDVKPLSSQYWCLKEDLYYYFYLQRKGDLYRTSSSRRKNQVFSTFANIIKTRKGSQVKSHHQKLMIKHKSIEKFLKFFQKRYSMLIDTNEEIKNQVTKGISFLTNDFEKIQEEKSIQSSIHIEMPQFNFDEYLNKRCFENIFDDYD